MSTRLPKPLHLAFLALAVFLAVNVVVPLQAATVFFSDTFERPDDLNLDSTTNGMSGVLISSGSLGANNVWIEPVDNNNGNQTNALVIGNQLKMGGLGTSVHVVLNQNFANVMSNGVLSISLDLPTTPSGATPLVQRYTGFGVGFTLAEGSTSVDRRLTRVADLYIAETTNGLIRINDEVASTRPAPTADVVATTTIDLDTTAATFVPGTLRVDLTITNFAAGSTVVYDVFFNGTDVLTAGTGTRSFVLSDNYEFYVGLEERSAAAVTNDNFTISASTYTPPAVSSLVWKASSNNIWDTTSVNWVDAGLGVSTYAFFSGANAIFNDLTANTTVSIPAAIVPGNLAVNNVSSNYTFTGAGSIGGTGTLSKTGTGILTLNQINSFSGGATLGGGRVRLSGASSLGVGPVSLSGATLSSDSTAARTLSNPVKVTIASGFGDSADNGVLTLTSPVDFNGAGRILTVNSDTVFAAGATNGAVGSKQGPANLTIKGLVNFTALEDVLNGTLTYDAATVTSNARIIPDAAADSAARLVVTNGSSIVSTSSNGNLRSGRAGASTGTNYVDLAGLYSLPSAVLPDGCATLYGLAAYSEMTFWKGADFTANAVTNSAGSYVGNTVFKFNGGMLRARMNNPQFFEGLSQAFVQAGGANIDDNGFAIAINQALQDDLASPGGGLTKYGAGTLTLNGGNTYTGPTVVSNGTLVISAYSFLGGGSVRVANNATLAVTNVNSTLTLPSLVMGSGGPSTLKMMLGTANPWAVPLSVTSLNLSGSVAINITGQNLTPARFTLLQWGSRSGSGTFHLGTLPPGISATLIETANGVDLNITAAIRALAWTGSAGNGLWDTTSSNWLDPNTYVPSTYSQTLGVGDAVVFDDTFSPLTANIIVPSSVSPVSMGVNSAVQPYTFSGAGKISGIAALVKDGFFGLTLGMANDYTGGTIVNSGALYAGANQAFGTGPIVLNMLSTLASDSTSPRVLPNIVTITVNDGVTFGDDLSNTGRLTLGGLDLGGSTGRNLLFKSDVIITGSITNGGIASKRGAGKMVIQGAAALSTALATHYEGDLVIDGGSLLVRDGWRLENTVASSALRFVVTNGGVFQMDTSTGNFRVGLTGGDNSATNILDIAGTFSLSGTGGNGRVDLGQSGAYDYLYLRSGGRLSCYAITSTSPGITEAYFDGGTLAPYTNNVAFLQGMTNAYIGNGGLTVDTVGRNITIAQSLQASGSGGLTKIGDGVLTLTGTNTYTGSTVVNGGKLVITPAQSLATGPIQVNTGAILSLQSPAAGSSVPVASITANDGATIETQFAATPASGNLSASIGSLALNGAVKVNVSAPGLTVGQFPLFSYGSISGSGSLVVGQLPLGVNATLVTNASTKTIELVVSSFSPALWTGIASGTWDIATTNWTMQGSPIAYADGASVRFDDTANTSIVSLSAAFSPGTVVVENSTLSYQFNGQGGLAGGTSLVKSGTNVLAINTVNTFLGPVTVQAGTILAGTASALGATNGSTTILNGASLDVNGRNLGLEPIIVSGSGVGGRGALVNSGLDQGNALLDVTLTGDTVVRAESIFGVRMPAETDPGFKGNGFKLTKIGPGIFQLNGGQANTAGTRVWDCDLGDIDILEGTLAFERRMTMGRQTGKVAVSSGAILQFFALNNNVVPIQTKAIQLNNGTLRGSGASASDTNILASPISLAAGSNFVTTLAGSSLLLQGPISGPGSAYFSGNVVLAAANSYTGGTVVTNGTLVLASGGGFPANTSISVLRGATLEVSASPWTLNAGQSLYGEGLINGAVQANGAVSPGLSIGTLTFSSDLALTGSTVIEINKDAGLTNDMIVVNGALTLGGQLNLAITGATPLAVNDIVKIFSFAGTAAGSITVNGPAGYTWDTSSLAVDGTIKVLTVASGQAPQITQNPASRTSTGGTTATFTGAASGSPAPAYYWLYSPANPSNLALLSNGGQVSGATTTTLSINNVHATNAGFYAMVAYNTSGSVTSQTAQLTFQLPTQPQLTSTVTNAKLVLSWSDPDGIFTLYSATNIAGTFEPITGSGNPYTNSMAEPKRFFQLRWE